MCITLQPVVPENDEFLFRVYAATRQQEMAAWGWDQAQQDAFLRLQFRAQQGSYRAAFPGAEHRLILQDGEAVGRILVHRTEHEIRLVDIALLPEHRNCGIGTRLIRDLIEESRSSRRPLRLQVATSNRAAARLYERLGFSLTGENEMYYQMEWNPVPGVGGAQL